MLDTAFELRQICLKNEKRYITPEKTKQLLEDDLVNKILQFDEFTSRSTEIQEQDELSICHLCNIEFKSDHDKRMHDNKDHSREKFKELKKFLCPAPNIRDPPIEKKEIPVNNSLDTTPCLISNINEDIIQIDNEPDIKYNSTSNSITCQICYQNFRSKEEHDVHVNLHLAKCCRQSFPTISLLQLHMFREHGRVCGICDESFSDINLLSNHVVDHTQINWFKCNFCGKSFKTNTELERHRCKYYSCQPCPQIRLTSEAYDGHMVIHKAGVVADKKLTKHYCPFCKKFYKSHVLLIRHYKRAHSNVSRKCLLRKRNLYMCRICYEEFHLPIHLKTHMLQIHCNSEITIPIVDCRKDKFYKEQEGLIINFEIPPRYINNKSYIKKDVQNRRNKICFICRTMFSTKMLLVSHLKQQHELCCGKRLNTSIQILKHNFVHYRNNKSGRIFCAGCANVYKTYPSLIRHVCLPNSTTVSEERKKSTASIIEIHRDDSDEETLPSLKPDGLSCDICEKLFRCKSTLLQHIRIHF